MSRVDEHDHLVVVRVAGAPERAWATFGAHGPIGLALRGRARAAGRAVLSIGAPRRTPVGTRREVRDAEGVLLGELEHRTQLSLARSPWAVVGPGDRGVLAWTREPSAARALAGRLLRRLAPRTELMVGQRAQAEVVPAGPGRWALDLTRVPPDVLDRRLALALLVALDGCRR